MIAYLRCILTMILAEESCAIQKTDTEVDMKVPSIIPTSQDVAYGMDPGTQDMTEDVKTEQDFGSLMTPYGLGGGVEDEILHMLRSNPTSCTPSPATVNISC